MRMGRTEQAHIESKRLIENVVEAERLLRDELDFTAHSSGRGDAHAQRVVPDRLDAHLVNLDHNRCQ